MGTGIGGGNMATFTVRVELKRRDGSTEDGGLIELAGDDYESFDEQAALSTLRADGQRYGFDIDKDVGMVYWRGLMIPVEDFAGLAVSIVSKSKA